MKIKTVEDEETEIEALWVAELQERYRAIQTGEVECIPAADAMRQARERRAVATLREPGLK